MTVSERMRDRESPTRTRSRGLVREVEPSDRTAISTAASVAIAPRGRFNQADPSEEVLDALADLRQIFLNYQARCDQIFAAWNARQ